MSYITCYSILFTIAATFMTGSLKYSAVNRSFMLLHRGPLEAAITDRDWQGYYLKQGPRFDSFKAHGIVISYLEDNILKYTTECYVTFDDYDDAELTKESEGVRPIAIRVSIKAKINYLYTYENSRVFIITQCPEFL